MNTVDIIAKKRDGKALTYDELEYLVMGYTDGSIPDYQMSAFLMAVYLKDMTKEETVSLTKVMKNSGEIVDLSGIDGIKVDKHSTGGVGDKTTLIAAPIAAACGVPVAKMSGRGLGFTGGTIDKLEAIPGFRTSIEKEDFFRQVNDKGIAVIGQTGHIAPADKKIYALRDVTATVANLSLITSSIMSKKLAAGSDAILLDVKCGKGAFMQTQQEAEALAKYMVEIGHADGKETMALITDMSQPLGNAVGNSLEVIEAIEVLKGNGPEDITTLSVELAGMMVYLSKITDNPEEGKVLANKALAEGHALNKFREFIKGQGGDDRIVDDYTLLPQSKFELILEAAEDGYISSIDAMMVGNASQSSGAGREKKEDEIDLSAGVYFCKKTGDAVNKGDVICKVYGNDNKKVSNALEKLKEAVVIDSKESAKPLLIKAEVHFDEKNNDTVINTYTHC